MTALDVRADADELLRTAQERAYHHPRASRASARPCVSRTAREILLLDEPTAAFDVRHQELARRLADAGRTVVAVLHDLNAAAAYADEIAVLKDGRLAALGPPWLALTEAVLHDVFEHPVLVVAHPVCDCPLVLAGREVAATRG